MLTRLEVDGFKNLMGVAVDFGPLTCIAGPNSVGKSNLFDAIRFLSLLADHTLVEAALRVRDGDIETSDLRDLFYRDTQDTTHNDAELRFRIAAEMIVEPQVRDDFGRSAEATSTGAGGHIPATLYRLATRAERAGEEAADIYADVANRLARLVPISSLEVEVDDVRQMLTAVAQERSGVRLPAAGLSDGTLRFLTLAVLVADPEMRGLICIEEPENGIHPARMGEMTELLQTLAVDQTITPDDENPLRQVIVATHSPVFVQLQRPDDLLFAQEVKIRRKDGAVVRTLRFRPLAGTWRARQDTTLAIGLSTIVDYLAAPENAQLVWAWRRLRDDTAAAIAGLRAAQEDRPHPLPPFGFAQGRPLPLGRARPDADERMAAYA